MAIDQQSETSLRFESHWADLRKGDELVPLYSTFDPLDLADLLPLLVIAEIDLEALTMPIILAGKTIRDFVGFELTGQDFLENDKTDDLELGWRHRRPRYGLISRSPPGRSCRPALRTGNLCP